jgi:hypothetical protein
VAGPASVVVVSSTIAAAAADTKGSKPAAEILQPAEGAVPVPAAGPSQAEMDEMIQREVARRERIAAEAKAARERKRAAAAAANSATGEDESVSDDDTGGGASTTDARALRRAYLCRTQHRC